MENNTEDMKDDIRKYAEIEAVGNTNGGKTLIKSLRTDVSGAVNALSNNFKTSSHVELMALCADLKAKLDLYTVLVKAPGNKNEIADLLEEELRTS